MIDHLVYAAADLEGGMDAVEALVGVRPVPGGKHTGRGTHNALLALGDGRYLEIIAPDPEQPDAARPLPFGLDGIRGRGRLVTWAAKAPDLDARVAAAGAVGYDAGAVTPLGRELPDGSRLQWRLARPPRPTGDGLVPFLIDWGDAPHPSASAPGGCTLVALRGEHPDPDDIRRSLRALGLDLPVERAVAPALVAAVHGPRGTVELR